MDSNISYKTVNLTTVFPRFNLKLSYQMSRQIFLIIYEPLYLYNINFIQKKKKTFFILETQEGIEYNLFQKRVILIQACYSRRKKKKIYLDKLKLIIIYVFKILHSLNLKDSDSSTFTRTHSSLS